MTALILGGHGYIGSALAPHLSAYVTDPGWFWREEVTRDTVRPDVIVNLAAVASAGKCMANPDWSWAVNVDHLAWVLDRLEPEQLLIHASSGSVYGSTPLDAVESDAPAAGIGAYDEQKLAGDRLIADAIERGKRVVSLRFGTLAGVAPHTRTDVMVNAMVWSALSTGEIHVANRDKRRALLFLPDLLRAVDLIVADPVPGVYNVASINTTVGYVADVVAHLTGARLVDASMSNPYSFGLDVSRFVGTFGEYRASSLDEVVAGLLERLPRVHRSVR